MKWYSYLELICGFIMFIVAYNLKEYDSSLIASTSFVAGMLFAGMFTRGLK